jgi:hypothetical protein
MRLPPPCSFPALLSHNSWEGASCGRSLAAAACALTQSSARFVCMYGCPLTAFLRPSAPMPAFIISRTVLGSSGSCGLIWVGGSKTNMHPSCCSCRQMFPHHRPYEAQPKAEPGAAPAAQQQPAAAAVAQQPTQQQQQPGQPAGSTMQAAVVADPRMQQQPGTQAPPAAGASQPATLPDGQQLAGSVQPDMAPPTADPRLQQPAAATPPVQPQMNSQLDPRQRADTAQPGQAPTPADARLQQQQGVSVAAAGQPHTASAAPQPGAGGPLDPRLQGNVAEAGGGQHPKAMQQPHRLNRSSKEWQMPAPAVTMHGAVEVSPAEAGSSQQQQQSQPPPVTTQRPARQMTGFKAHSMQYRR